MPEWLTALWENDTVQVIVRSLLAVVIGAVIGGERSRHGRAAGPRTHILVCLGAAATSMTSMFVNTVLGANGDVFRISAQVISGIGFLGAGVIILKNNSTITGLTTAAGVWATGAIGVALGYGFYTGAIVVSILLLLTMVLFARFERRKVRTGCVYVEIDDMYRTNAILQEVQERMGENFNHQIQPPRSERQGHLGLLIFFDKKANFDCASLREIENVVYTIEE